MGVLVRKYGDFADAEDSVQDALIAASYQWIRDGWPENPYGWLLTVASRKMIDRVRSDVARKRREISAVVELEEPESKDSLDLLLMCCHPAISQSSAIALTLRAVAGLSTEQIARAFLVPGKTMSQRISRAKRTIKESGLELQVPQKAQRKERLAAAMHVLYLMFNEGYLSSNGASLQRPDLADEAISIMRKLHELEPGHPEVKGLLALMLLSHSRRFARAGGRGELIPLNEQNRALWDQENILEGATLLKEALIKGYVGSYQIQAAIHALHSEAKDTDTTDWTQILGLYRMLMKMENNPMVSLNAAIAQAMVEGPSSGLATLREIGNHPSMKSHYRFFAVRGHLHEMTGEYQKAIHDFLAAARRTDSLPERNYLNRKSARLNEQSRPGTT